MHSIDCRLQVGVLASTANRRHKKQESEGISMKRFHAHVRVGDLESSVRFYSTLFGAEPTVLKPDYAKWVLDDPRVNFAITAGTASTGLDHLGFQVESDEDLATIAGRLAAAGESVAKEENVSCCYARGNKGWVSDPSGISWETFHTLEESTIYDADVAPRVGASKPQATESCCTPASSSSNACCCGAEAQ
jgi:catechol 2,3-dioxygenase-like lactoylglutathione lyase family enzyme